MRPVMIQRSLQFFDQNEETELIGKGRGQKAGGSEAGGEKTKGNFCPLPFAFCLPSSAFFKRCEATVQAFADRKVRMQHNTTKQ